jgi:hypothetical protein
MISLFCSGSKSEQKSQLLYRSCLDLSGRIEELGVEPLQKIIEDVGGWNLSSSGKNKLQLNREKC